MYMKFLAIGLLVIVLNLGLLTFVQGQSATVCADVGPPCPSAGGEGTCNPETGTCVFTGSSCGTNNYYCTNPPSTSCSANILSTYSSTGTCTAGLCQYAQTNSTCQPTITTCPDGSQQSCGNTCSGSACGQCTPDCSAHQAVNQCANVVCNTPPASKCVGNSVNEYSSTGTCSNGSCSYSATARSCPNGCDKGQCKAETEVATTCLDLGDKVILTQNEEATEYPKIQAVYSKLGKNTYALFNSVRKFGCVDDQLSAETTNCDNGFPLLSGECKSKSEYPKTLEIEGQTLNTRISPAGYLILSESETTVGEQETNLLESRCEGNSVFVGEKSYSIPSGLACLNGKLSVLDSCQQLPNGVSLSVVGSGEIFDLQNLLEEEIFYSCDGSKFVVSRIPITGKTEQQQSNLFESFFKTIADFFGSLFSIFKF